MWLEGAVSFFGGWGELDWADLYSSPLPLRYSFMPEAGIPVGMQQDRWIPGSRIYYLPRRPGIPLRTGIFLCRATYHSWMTLISHST
jgi:hypothetical protein